MQIPTALDRLARKVFQGLTHSEVEDYSEFLVEAVITYVARQEHEHNGGRRWPAVTAAQMRRAPRRRGAQTGVDRTLVTTYPGAEAAGRIRGTAIGLKIALNELYSAAIEARVRAAPQIDVGSPQEA